MKINNGAIVKIKEESKKFFKDASGCHDWTHIERVRNLALRIGKKEKARLDVLEIASFLHDIGRKKEMKSRGLFCHAEEGGRLAKNILKKYSIEKKNIDNIIHCISSHRYRNKNIPKTIEAKVLFDADKLDSIGAIGVARNFLFAGNAGSKNLYTGNEKRLAKENKDYCYTKEDSALLEYEIKLKYIKDKMLTKEGKKIAKERHDFMVDFHERFEKEIKGIL
jgi:uncharacterized protein